jgi:hypothetical protein
VSKVQFAAQTSRESKFHRIGDDGWTLCGRLPSNKYQTKAMHVPLAKRCGRPGCRGFWPDFRAEGDNTIIRIGPSLPTGETHG